MVVCVLEALLSLMMRLVRFIICRLVVLLLLLIVLLHHVILIVCHWSLNDFKCLYFLLLRDVGSCRISWGRSFREIASWCLRATWMVRWRGNWRRNAALLALLHGWSLFTSNCLCFHRHLGALRQMILERLEIRLNSQRSRMGHVIFFETCTS